MIEKYQNWTKLFVRSCRTTQLLLISAIAPYYNGLVSFGKAFLEDDFYFK